MDRGRGSMCNRSVMRHYGEDILRLMRDASDSRWAEWLKAPLEHAAARGDGELTTVLIEAGANGNALFPAVSYGHHTLVRILLEKGASTSEKNADGYTPLHLAAKNRQGRIVRTLLIEGADANEPDRRGRSPLHLACISGDAASIKALLAAGSDVSHRHGSNGYAALDFAVRCGKIEASRVLLRKGADINARGNHGRTALHVAMIANQANAMQFLSQQPGVDMNCEDDDRKTPLQLAASEGRVFAVKTLIKLGVDVEHRTSRALSFDYGPRCDDFAPMHFAALHGHVEVLRALARGGADVEPCGNFHLMTPLHHAAAGNEVHAIDFLIRAGASVDGGTTDWSPLHLAVECNHPEAIRALARHGADLHSTHEEGGTPLGEAVGHANVEAMNALLAFGADPNVTSDTDPVLHTAARSSGPRSADIVRILLEHGADVNAIWDQEQALHEAVVEGTVEIIDLLVKHGADVDGHGSYLSPLHVACYSSNCSAHCDKVSALLGHGAAIDSRDDASDTALHMAAANLSTEMVDFLLRAGADETLANEDGNTPAEQVRSMDSITASDKENLDRVLRLLDGAPGDRAWRRRGFLVLCHAFPRKARLESALRTRAVLPRASKRGAGARRGGSSRAGGGVLAMTVQNGGFNNFLARLFRVQEEGIFREVMSFL
ncbi:unnamed protein product [Scytosiphon promiscuus]